VDIAEPVAVAPKPAPGRLARTIILILAILSLIMLIAVLATAVRQVKRMSDGGEGRPAYTLFYDRETIEEVRS